ncbi:hypothetical protein GQ457_04G002860 [Hibiscus cannabinus]
MQCFLLPKAVCVKLESIMNSFWWRNSTSSKGIHWSSWASLCLPKSHGGMGFRDMSKFNIALLAKQGWRILNNPSSLLARVMKARYFPKSDFMNASLGSSPSYTWRSIYSARGLLEQGIGWRVGTGLNISVWNDAWIPGNGDGRVHQNIDFRYPKVSDLIVPESNTWNHDLLCSLFDTAMVDRIRCIPLAKSKPPDELIWRGLCTGSYTPKSGYKLLLEEVIAKHTSSIDPRASLYSSFYKSLWDLNIPAKCKIFLWRLSKKFLPTFANLQQRRLQVRNTCPFCDSGAESVAHLAFSCPTMLQILEYVGLPPIPAYQSNDFGKLFATWFTQQNKIHQMLLSVSYWVIWYARNKLVHEGSTCSITKSAAHIRALILEFESLSSLSTPSVLPKNVKWTPPDCGVIKLNFDASFISSSHSSVSGVVARDSQGLIMAACTYPHTGIADAFVAEAVACERAVMLAIDLGFRSIQIEGDSLSVIKKLNSSAMDKSAISPIIRDILLLKSLFEAITFSFVGRTGNKAAHALAKLGLQQGEPQYWIEEAPVSIEQVVLQEYPS